MRDILIIINRQCQNVRSEQSSIICRNMHLEVMSKVHLYSWKSINQEYLHALLVYI
jgi:hypothetical protein